MAIKVKNIGKHLSVRRLEPTESGLVTEDSAATAFVAQHGKDLRFCHTSGKWFRWNGSFWAEDRIGATFQQARELARALSLTQDDKKRYATPPPS
jgi:putative DNA primase/helicase